MAEHAGDGGAEIHGDCRAKGKRGCAKHHETDRLIGQRVELYRMGNEARARIADQSLQACRLYEHVRPSSSLNS